MKIVPAVCTALGAIFSCTNYFRVIFTGGVGKNGSTIAVSPVIANMLGVLFERRSFVSQQGPQAVYRLCSTVGGASNQIESNLDFASVDCGLESCQATQSRPCCLLAFGLQVSGFCGPYSSLLRLFGSRIIHGAVMEVCYCF